MSKISGSWLCSPAWLAARIKLSKSRRKKGKFQLARTHCNLVQMSSVGLLNANAQSFNINSSLFPEDQVICTE